MSSPPDRLVRASVALTALGLSFFAVLALLSAHAAPQRMPSVSLLTLGAFALTGFGVLGFFLVGVRHFTKPAPAEKPRSGPSP
jgi:hypothetical protein